MRPPVREGALGGGPPMSHVDFKNWQSRVRAGKSLSLIFPDVTCRILRKGLCVTCRYILCTHMSHVTKPHVACRF